MFDYLQKYNDLPKELRSKLSSASIMAAIENIENKYGINLAATIMRVAVKEIKINDLIKYFITEHNLSEEKANDLSIELNEKVFISIARYLGLDEKGIKEDKNKRIIEKAKIPPPPAKKEEAKIFFSPEDKKEIDTISNKVNGFRKISSRNLTQEKLDFVINELNINFGSDLIAQRFRNILKTYLMGIRDKIITKQTLIKPIENGGLGFDKESANNIFSVIDGGSGVHGMDLKITPPKKLLLPEDEKNNIQHVKNTEKLKEIGVRDVDYNFAEEMKKKNKELDIEHELAPPAPSVVAGPPPTRLRQGPGTQGLRQTSPPTPTISKPQPKIQPKHTPAKKSPPMPAIQKDKPPIIAQRKAEVGVIKKTKAEFKPKAQKKSFSIFSKLIKKSQPKKEFPKVESEIKRQVVNGKIRIEDVRMKPKIMGPIDELKYMNLVNFRRLNNDPQKAAQKIKEKINILEDDYSKKVEGINAWRLSFVNKLYLKMSEESIGSRKPINAIIERRKVNNKDFLNINEIEAIIRLNKSLRF